jgi:nicotinic acid mononucleotide adenylyltransferase
MQALRIPGVDISSTHLRERVRRGQPITYLTPPAVERLVLERSLYV